MALATATARLAPVCGRGTVYARTADRLTAIDCLNQALALYRDLGNCKGQACALTELENLGHLAGDEDAATTSLTVAMSLFSDLDDRFGQADVGESAAASFLRRTPTTVPLISGRRWRSTRASEPRGPML